MLCASGRAPFLIMRTVAKAALSAACIPYLLTACGGSIASAYSFDTAMEGVRSTQDYTFTMEVSASGESRAAASCDVDDHVRLRCVLRADGETVEMLVDVPGAVGYISSSTFSEMSEGDEGLELFEQIEWLMFPLEEMTDLDAGEAEIFTSPLAEIGALEGVEVEDGGMFERDGEMLRKWNVELDDSQAPRYTMFVSEDGALRGVQVRVEGADPYEIEMWISNVDSVKPIELPSGASVMDLEALLQELMGSVLGGLDDVVEDTVSGAVEQTARAIARNATAIGAVDGRETPSSEDLALAVEDVMLDMDDGWTYSPEEDIVTSGCATVTLMRGGISATWNISVDTRDGGLPMVSEGSCLV